MESNNNVVVQVQVSSQNSSPPFWERAKNWLKIPTYNAFRYGMITLYVGTLLMVIGYHNPWMGFSR